MTPYDEAAHRRAARRLVAIAAPVAAVAIVGFGTNRPALATVAALIAVALILAAISYLAQEQRP